MLSDNSFEVLEKFMATVTADAPHVKTADLSELYDRRFHELLKRLDKKSPSVPEKKLVYEVCPLTPTVAWPDHACGLAGPCMWLGRAMHVACI